MKDIIKKILKEEFDDFEWADEIINPEFVLATSQNMLKLGDTVMVDGFVDWDGEGYYGEDDKYDNDIGTIVGMPIFRNNYVMIVKYDKKRFNNPLPSYDYFTTPKECLPNKCWPLMRDYTRFESCDNLRVYVKSGSINESEEDDFGWTEDYVNPDMIPIKRGENYIIDFCEEIILPDKLRDKFNNLYGKELVDSLVKSVDINIMQNRGISNFVSEGSGFQVIVNHENGEPNTGWNPCTIQDSFTKKYPQLKSFTPSEFLKLVFV